MDPLENLTNLLGEEIERLKGLLLLCEEEKKSLVAEDIHSLNRENRAQEELISRLREVERARVKVTEEIGKSLDLPGEGFSLSELLPHLEEPYSTRLKQMGDRLRQYLERIKSINRTNALLLANSLRIIQKKVSFLTKIGEGDDTLYCQEGRISPRGVKRRIVDRRA